MRDADLIQDLEQVVERLGMEVRWEAGDFSGGVYRMQDRTVLMVNRDLPSFDKVRVLCRALSQQDLSRIYLVPALRRRILRWTGCA